eukprot:5847528-Prymnesium_polylepis.1
MKRCALLAVVPLAVAWRCQPPPRPRCAAVRVSAPPLAELAREQAELTLEEQAFADSFDDDEAARAALQAKQAWLSECATPVESRGTRARGQALAALGAAGLLPVRGLRGGARAAGRRVRRPAALLERLPARHARRGRASGGVRARAGDRAVRGHESIGRAGDDDRQCAQPDVPLSGRPDARGHRRAARPLPVERARQDDL